MIFKVMVFLIKRLVLNFLLFGTVFTAGLVAFFIIMPPSLHFLGFETKPITFDLVKRYGMGALASAVIAAGILSIVDTYRYGRGGYFSRDYF
jgi:hypothetical protein